MPDTHCKVCDAELTKDEESKMVCPKCLSRLPRFGDDEPSTVGQVLRESGVPEATVDLSKNKDLDSRLDPTNITGLVNNANATRYEMRGVLGKGGMGLVLNAKDINLRREVALKVMHRDMRENADAVLRFVEEAQVTGQLEHPNIVPVYELGVDDAKQIFYTMKRVAGRTLRSVLRSIKNGEPKTVSEFPLSRLLDVFLKACDAVAYAHSKNVIHRDLKPENIMIGEYGEVLIVDWGLSKILVEKNAVPDSQTPGTAVAEKVESIRTERRL